MGVSKTLLVGAVTVMTLVMPGQALAAISVDADANAGANVSTQGEPSATASADATASVVVDGVADVTIGEEPVLPTEEEVGADASANVTLAANTDNLGVNADVNLNLNANLSVGGSNNGGSVLGASTGTLPRAGVAGFAALLFSLLGSAGAARFATKRALA